MNIIDLYKSLFGRKGIADGSVIDLAEHGRVGGVSTGQPFKFVTPIDSTTGAVLTPPTGYSTSAKQDTGNTSLASAVTNLQTLNSLVPTVYDYISLSYTGSNLTTVVFKLGGSGGTTVSTLTFAYSGSTLTSVTKT